MRVSRTDPALRTLIFFIAFHLLALFVPAVLSKRFCSRECRLASSLRPVLDRPRGDDLSACGMRSLIPLVLDHAPSDK